MSYLKTFPRDLFFQAKLLNQLGHLSMYINDYSPNNLYVTQNLEEDISIAQLESAGELTCTNIIFYTKNKTPIILFIPYNKDFVSRKYSLQFLDNEYLDMLVFHKDHTEKKPKFTQEFTDHINNN